MFIKIIVTETNIKNDKAKMKGAFRFKKVCTT